MSPPVAQKGRPPEDPSVCDVCGSVYTAKTWRRDRPLPAKMMDAAGWTVCPACKQAKTGKYFGRVLIRGSNAISNLDAVRLRITNVERRAEFTQPEHRIISSKWDGATLEGADHLAKARTSDRPRTPESIRRTRALYLVRRGRQPHSYLAEWKTPAECLTVKEGGFRRLPY